MKQAVVFFLITLLCAFLSAFFWVKGDVFIAVALQGVGVLTAAFAVSITIILGIDQTRKSLEDEIRALREELQKRA